MPRKLQIDTDTVLTRVEREQHDAIQARTPTRSAVVVAEWHRAWLREQAAADELRKQTEEFLND